MRRVFCSICGKEMVLNEMCYSTLYSSKPSTFNEYKCECGRHFDGEKAQISVPTEKCHCGNDMDYCLEVLENKVTDEWFMCQSMECSKIKEIKNQNDKRKQYVDQCEYASIFEEAAKFYGKKSRINHVIEEMSELTKELCKNNRGFDTRDNILEEITDVEILLKQVKVIYGFTENEEFEMRVKKIAKLTKQLYEDKAGDL